MKQLKSGAILSYVHILLAALTSIVYMPFMLQALGQSEFGLYSLSNSVVGYLSVLNLGLGSSYIHFYVKYRNDGDEKDIRKLNSLFLLVYIALGLVALCIGLAIAFHTDVVFGNRLTTVELRRSSILIIILTINMVVSFLASIFTSYVVAKEQFVMQKLLMIANTVVPPIVAIPLLAIGYKSIMIVSVIFFVAIGTHLINLIYCIKRLGMRFDFHQLDFRVLKRVLFFTSFIAINLIIDQVNWNVDQFLLGRFHGTEVVAVYGVATTINLVYLQFSTAISSVFAPKIHAMTLRENAVVGLNELFVQVGRVQFMVIALVASGFVFFGQAFLDFWAGEEYGEAYYITLLLILPATIPLIQNVGIEIQRAYNKHQFRAYLYLIMAVINVGISIPLCMTFEGSGAAIGTGLSLIVANGIVMNYYYHRYIQIDIVAFWRQIMSIVPALIPPAIFGVLARRFADLNSILIFLMCIFLYTSIYVASIWLLGLNKEEKKIARRKKRE